MVIYARIMVECNKQIKTNRTKSGEKMMLILNVWEWVINLFVLGCASLIWALAMFISMIIISLTKDFILKVVRDGK